MSAKKEISSTGPICVEWMRQYLASPMGTGEAFTPTKAQEEFINASLAFNPATGGRYASKAVLSLPKGSGKSPFGAAFLLAYCLAPVHPRVTDDGLQYEALYDTKVPHAVVAAASEAQAKNSFGAFPAIVTPELEATYGVLVRSKEVRFDGGGAISLMALGPRGAEGHPTDIAFVDQTEAFTTKQLLDFYHAIGRNCEKNGGLLVEAPNAPEIFAVGEAASYDAAKSVSEMTLMAYRKSMRAGRSPLLDDGLVYKSDFFTGNVDKLRTLDDVVAALEEAYKGSIEPNGFKTKAEIQRLARSFFTADDITTWARFFLNIPGSVSNSWLATDQVTAATKSLPEISAEDVFTIGFDGARGVTSQTTLTPDHTVITLAAKKASDPDAPVRFYLHKVWMRPPLETGPWVPPRDEVIDEILRLIRDGINGAQCVGCFADSSYWEGDFSFLEQQQPVKRLKVSATRRHKVAVVNQDKRSNAMPFVFEHVYAGIAEGTIFINDDGALAQYFTSAVRRQVPQGYLLYKTHKTGEKIDGAIACCMAYAALMDHTGSGAVVSAARGEPVRKRKMAVI